MLVAVIAGSTKIGVVLDAEAPVSAQLAALVDLVNGSPHRAGTATVDGWARGRWTLCWVDGTALKPTLSLAAQGVVDGTRLWLRFAADSEARIDVVEHVTSAVAQRIESTLATDHGGVGGPGRCGHGCRWCADRGGLLGRWRYGHLGWAPAVYCGGLAAALIAAAVIILARQTNNSAARGIGDTLLVTGCVPAALGAAALVPGPVGAPHAALGLARWHPRRCWWCASRDAISRWVLRF